MTLLIESRDCSEPPLHCFSLCLFNYILKKAIFRENFFTYHALRDIRRNIKFQYN
jgi:hypothetical protein